MTMSPYQMYLIAKLNSKNSSLDNEIITKLQLNTEY